MAIMSFLLAAGLLGSGPAQEPPPASFDLSIYFQMGSRQPTRISSAGRKPLGKGQSVKLKAYSGEISCGFVSGAAPTTGGFTLSSGAPTIPGTANQQPLGGAFKADQSTAVGWNVEATAVEIASDHVVVRLRWSRENQVGNKDGKGAEEIVVLLRPGDAIPLEKVSVPDVRNNCNNSMGALMVGLDAHAPAQARVASTDLWLVHKHPGGKETAQHLNVRGELGSPVPFFFDQERAGTAALDVFGRLTLRSGSREPLALELSAQRVLVGVPGLNNPNELQTRGLGQIGIEIDPNSVISFEIPLGTGSDWAPFAGHSISLRIKSRLIR